MARMLPPYCDISIKSKAEKRLFDLFRGDPNTHDWTCLHSLGLAAHVSQRYGEIDFVVLVPGEGAFCLEVKGGRVRCIDGTWEFQDRFGNTSRRQKSPFMQAREGMFSLQKAVCDHFGQESSLAHILFGFGVVFPDIELLHDDPEHEQWQVFDRNFRMPISAFVTQLARHTKRLHPNKSAPSQDDIRMLIGFLRPDFDYVMKPSDHIEQTELELLHLTEEQYGLLDMLQGNDRLVVDGAAGTGKTMIAMEYARRESRKGSKVLLLCFNRLLGKWIAAASVNEPNIAITADSFHHFLDKELISHSAHAAEFLRKRDAAIQGPHQEELFAIDYPLFALDALTESMMPPFDVLVIDEGQDLIQPEYLDVFDSLLRGGLAGGRWAFFCDFVRQAIFANGASEERMRAEISRRASHARFQLSINCRNTRTIGEETSVLSGFSSPPFRLSEVDGPAVEYRFFHNQEGERALVATLVAKLLSSGVLSNQIVILAPVRREHSCIGQEPLDNQLFDIVDIEDYNPKGLTKSAIRFSTIQAFKGLESSVVILIDIHRLDDEPARQILYVGMSRARHRLFVLLDDSAHAAYNRAVRRKYEPGVN